MGRCDARSDEGRSPQEKILQFRRRIWSSYPRCRGHAYGIRDEEGSRRVPGTSIGMASGTLLGRIRMFRAGRRQRFAARDGANGSRGLRTKGPSTDRREGKRR